MSSPKLVGRRAKSNMGLNKNNKPKKLCDRVYKKSNQQIQMKVRENDTLNIKPTLHETSLALALS